MKEKVKELHKQGLTFREIGAKLGISHSKAFRYFHGKRVVSGRVNVDVSLKVKEMRSDGMKLQDIADSVGVSIFKVHTILGNTGHLDTVNKNNIQRLSDMGFRRIEIAKKLGLNLRTVAKYTEVDKKEPKMKTIKTKKVKAVEPIIERYERLGKGYEKGMTEIEVKLNPNRDAGEKNKFKYRDSYGVKEVTIYVRDGVTREESANRWCNKFGVNLVGLV